MDYDLSVATPMGDSLVCNSILKSCVIQIEDVSGLDFDGHV